MILRGMDFGHVFTASGTRNFFTKDGWWYRGPWSWVGLDFRRTTFIAKTTTLHARAGNMTLRADRVTPCEWRPRCIRTYFRKGMTLNAVGLSGPGAAWLLAQEIWQRRQEPFVLSFMAVEPTLDARLQECQGFVQLLKAHLRAFSAPVGLQVNLSCPNVGIDAGQCAREADASLSILGELDIPLVPKVCATLPVEVARYISRHAAVDAIAVSNAIPWGALPDQINWEELFGTTVSPLAAYGGGALSGAPLFPIVRDWVVRAREAGVAKPIAAGGGVQTGWQAEQLINLGASAIELGTVFLLRPWRTKAIIDHIHHLMTRMIREDRFCAERRGICVEDSQHDNAQREPAHDPH